MVDGEKSAKARSVATGYQDPALRGGGADTHGCVLLRASHLQVVTLGVLGKWSIWSLDIKNACLQADGFGRDVLFRAPVEWEPNGALRFWKLRAPAFALIDAPVVFIVPCSETSRAP